MKKSIPHTNLYVGQLVTVTDHPETQVYTIAAIDGQAAVLQWCEGNRHSVQAHDKYGLLKPTLQQIEYSIAANGPLVTTKELADWHHRSKAQSLTQV